MKDNLTRVFGRYQKTFSAFSTSQKLVALIGTGALLLAGFMVFKWASTPSYAPLYSSLSSADAAAVIDNLNSQGVPYKLSNGGNTIMVPQDQVYGTRISLSGEGLPSSSDSGYSLLDKQGLSTSQFQEQTNFKRAMEAELAKTVGAIDGVSAAVVHLALPEKKVFATTQDPASASVLVKTKPGASINDEQVQAIVHLVASSIDGLDPTRVAVSDASGKLLSAGDGSEAGSGTGNSRNQQVDDYQSQLKDKVQTMLDRVLGPGNSTTTVTANLDFDKSVTETKKYTYDPKNPPLSQAKAAEQYTGANANGAAGGVVGPDGQMDSSANGTNNGEYKKSSQTQDNALDTTIERREKAPGSVNTLHVAVALDAAAARTVNASDIEALVTSAIGIDTNRGDTVQVSAVPFDRSEEKSAKAELAAAEKAAAKAGQMNLFRNAGLALIVVLILILAWLKGRKRAKARATATEYVVEQLRQEALERQQLAQAQLEANAAIAALEGPETNATDEIREELAALVERQPEDVAALLRGWLVERS